jgi:nitroreductase
MRSPVDLILTQVGNPDDAARDLEDYAACACALQNLLLAAHAEGLVAHVSTDRMLGYEATRRYLGLEAADRVVALVNLGYLREGATVKAGVRDAPVVRWEWR